MIPNLSGLRPREPLRHRRGWQRQLRRPLLRQHHRPARPRIPNLSAQENHFGVAAAGSDDFGGLFSADTSDQLALEFLTCNHVLLWVPEGDQGDGEHQEGDDHALLHLR